MVCHAFSSSEKTRLVIILLVLSIFISSATWAIADTFSLRADGEKIRSCTTIDSPGKYVLVRDITNEDGGTCIEIQANNVQFDGNGHTLRGPHTHGSAAVAAVHSNELQNVTVRNLHVSNWELGVGARAVQNLSIIGVETRENVNGILVYESTDVLISDSDVADNYFGITAMLSKSVEIRSNEVRSDNRSGILVNESRDVTVADNTVNETEYGIWLFESNDIDVRNNTVVQNQAFEDRVRAIYLVRSHDNIIENNEVTHNRPPGDEPNAYGLNLHESNRNRIRGNTLTHNNIGIWMWLSDENVISSNSFDENFLGMGLKQSSDNKIVSNTANGNDYGGIVLHYDSDDNELVDNTANGNTYGITIIGPGGDPFTEAGVLLDERYDFGASGNRLRTNRADENEVHGISLFGRVIDTVLRENQANENGQNGFHISLASDNVLEENHGSRNNGFGVYLADSDLNTLADNDVCQNEKGGVVIDSRSEHNRVEPMEANCTQRGG